MSESAERESIERSLAEMKQAWTGVPRLHELRFRIGEDQTGDPSVFVTAVLEEQTRDEDWTTANLDPLIKRVRQVIGQTGTDRWVYVSFTRPSDLSRAA